MSRSSRARDSSAPSTFEHNAKTLGPILRSYIARDAVLMTDEANAYKAIGPHFASDEFVVHSNKEYARGSHL